MQRQWLVVGLGNPGQKYQNNRHNLGYRVVEELAQRAGQRFTTHKSAALVAPIRIGFVAGGAPGPKVILTKPGSYMNLSGRSVAALMRFFEVTPDRLVVVHDELDLPAYCLRLKVGGGEGGHNGLRSISDNIGTKDYVRLRIGIGRPVGPISPADFVLSDLPARVRPDWEATIAQAADVIEAVAQHGLQPTQQALHTNH